MQQDSGFKHSDRSSLRLLFPASKPAIHICSARFERRNATQVSTRLAKEILDTVTESRLRSVTVSMLPTNIPDRPPCHKVSPLFHPNS